MSAENKRFSDELAREREKFEKEREKMEKETEKQRRIEELSSKPMPNLVGTRHISIEKKEEK